MKDDLAHSIFVTKSDGEQEVFSPAKLERSLERAGASSTMRARIAGHLLHELKPGITTEEIYRHAFRMLKEEEEAPVAARYSVKRGVFALGPSGFPFEQFLAEVLRAHGWTARTGQILTGRCVPHEVDVLAEKDGKRIGIEAKFHNDAGGKTDVKDALYVKARYDDLRTTSIPSCHVDEGWLVTNTRFTRNAISYARCSGLTLLGWDYPRDHGLFSLIEGAHVHPITCLTSLSDSEKRRLLEKNIVLCKHIEPHLLKEYGIKPDHIPQVVEEARRLSGV
jgi:hypothetical protein